MNPHFSAAAQRTKRPRPPGLLVSLVGGLVASAAAGAGMAFLRWTFQVRTIPERLMEWLLLFIPPDLFEAGIQRFGFEAKRYALYGAAAGVLLLLAVLGAIVLRRGWSKPVILALGVGLWLFTMTVIMPLTSAGVFAMALLDGTGVAVTGYLAVALVYANTLVLVGGTISQNAGEHSPRSASRRSAVLLAGGALAAFGITFLVDRWAPKTRVTRVIVRDPQEPVPSGGVDPPNPHPNVVGAREATNGAKEPLPEARPDPTSSLGPGPQAPARPSSSAGVPEPPPARQLTRDKDGAVLPSGRRPGQLAELFTPNDDFYVVTKNAAGDPVLDAVEWRLIVDGEVQRPIQLDYASLRKLPAVEVTKTLECISNFVTKCEMAPFGCDLISTARWKGVRLSDVLALGGALKPGVVSLVTISADEFTTALPIEAALAPETLLVYDMNGQVLPREHGYPARLLVPGRYGMKSAKWVIALRAVGREFVDWYGQRNWSKQAIVKTMTRIDVPAPGAELPPGEHRIAGVAYAGDRGVQDVEFSPDDGDHWHVAELIEPPVSLDAWVRWQGNFSLMPGSKVTLMARATDGTGAVQLEAFDLPQPDGASGWHTVDVRAKPA